MTPASGLIWRDRARHGLRVGALTLAMPPAMVFLASRAGLLDLSTVADDAWVLVIFTSMIVMWVSVALGSVPLLWPWPEWVIKAPGSALFGGLWINQAATLARDLGLI